MKILVIKFKWIGDTVIAIPTLQAIREYYPNAILHVLIPEESHAILKNISWIDHIWPFERKRGKVKLFQGLRFIKKLRREQFDVSVDLVGNDRGAILSRLIGAKKRIGAKVPKGFLGRRFCYTNSIEEEDFTRHEVVRDLHILSSLSIPPPSHLCPKIQADPQLSAIAQKLIPANTILCHLSTSQPKKEWPIDSWVQFYKLFAKSPLFKDFHFTLIFSSGISPREQALLESLKKSLPQANVLPPCSTLDLFLAILKETRCVISLDTAPLHLAAALGRTTLGLYGPTASSRWEPLSPNHTSIQGRHCFCNGHLRNCENGHPCMHTITPSIVLEHLKQALEKDRK